MPFSLLQSAAEEKFVGPTSAPMAWRNFSTSPFEASAASALNSSGVWMSGIASVSTVATCLPWSLRSLDSF